jgi:hypothetical protein
MPGIRHSGKEASMMGHGEAGHEHGGMMQQCMDMMNSMMGGSATDTSSVASMGLNLPPSMIVALLLTGALGYLLGARRFRARA